MQNQSNRPSTVALAAMFCAAGLTSVGIVAIGLFFLLPRSPDSAPAVAGLDQEEGGDSPARSLPGINTNNGKSGKAGQNPLSAAAKESSLAFSKSDRKWLKITEAGRKSKMWLYVSLKSQSDGSRQAKLKFDNDTEKFPQQTLQPGQGIPLFPCSAYTLRQYGWGVAPNAASADEPKLLQSVRETDLYQVHKLSDFGAGNFNRSNDYRQSFDHRHVWSKDGAFLYALSGTRRGPKRQTLRKINTKTWEVESAIRPGQEICDLTMTAQGLVAITDPIATPDRKSQDGQTWLRLVPSSNQLQYYRGGIFLLDANSLQVKKGWVSPRVNEVAGHVNGDLIYLRSPNDALLVVDVKKGQLLSCYSYQDFHGDSSSDTTDSELHFIHPQLTSDGAMLVTHGMNNTVLPRRHAMLGARSVNTFAVSGADLNWRQSRKIGGVLSRFTRIADVGISDDYLCLPHRRFEFVTTDQVSNPIGSLVLPPETAIALDSVSQSVYCCWMEPQTSQLRLRMLRGGADTELVLATNVERDRYPSKFSRTEFADGELVHRNLWPFEMSVAPDGRGLIVFAPGAAYWIVPKQGPGKIWPFRELPPGPTASGSVASGSGASGSGASGSAPPAPADAPKDLVQQRAEMLTRGRSATALLKIPGQKDSGTAFCISEKGYFLTSTRHVENLEAGGAVSLVMNAGGLHERAVMAVLMHKNADVGVALLKSKKAEAGLTPLRLGRDETVSVTDSLTAFGYFRNPQSKDDDTPPRLTANLGSATSLRKSGDKLATIQFDGALLPGASGGPVLDANGQVVAVVRTWNETSGLHFLIPVSLIKNLQWPGFEESIVPAKKMAAVGDIKKATALVLIPNIGSGTAFCVDARGYFATNYHVVEGLAEDAELDLILNSAEANEEKVQAKVVRRIKDSDLALLKLTKAKSGLTVLPLSKSGELAEEMVVTAYGFPFGDYLALSKDSHPSISVNKARIAATEGTTLGVKSFEFLTQINPGNSGGPVVDEKGEVVGVVFATKLGAKKSYAIPVARLRTLMFSPDLTWTAKSFDFSQRRKASTFSVKVKTYLRSLDGMDLQLTLTPERGPATVLKLRPSGEEGLFAATAPLLDKSIPDYVRARFDFPMGSVFGVCADSELRIGEARYRLSEAPEGALDGAQILSGLKNLTIEIAGQEKVIDCSRALAASIESNVINPIAYEIVATQDGQEAARIAGSVEIVNQPKSTRREHFFRSRLRQFWERHALAPPSSPQLRIRATFGDETLSGFTADRRLELKKGSKVEHYQLSRATIIRSVGQSQSGEKLFYISFPSDGIEPHRSYVNSPLSGLKDLPIRIGESVVTMDLSDADLIRIEPILLSNRDCMPLGAEIADVVAGRHGTVLALHLPKAEQVVLFDVPRRSVTHQIPLADGDVRFAASEEKLLLVYPSLKAIERWNLVSGKRELTTELSQRGRLGGVVMGCGGRGPMLMHGYDDSSPPRSRWTLVDLETLQSRNVDAPTPNIRYPESPPLTASTDGTVFGSLNLALFVEGKSVNVAAFKEEKRPNVTPREYLVAPQSSSRFIYRHLVKARDGRDLLQFKTVDVLPTTNSEYCLTLSYSGRNSKKQRQVTINKLEGDEARPVASFIAFPFASPVRANQQRLPSMQRYHLDLPSRVLITIPPSNNELIFHTLPEWK